MLLKILTKVQNTDLKRRIIDISYKNKLSHLSSCLNAVDIIKDIYDKKQMGEHFVLSNGHAGLALYVVLEQAYGTEQEFNAEQLLHKHGIHPNYDPDSFLDCSTGSLGHGLPIAVGMALADKEKGKNVYCMISDGEASEGSIWEALRVAQEQNLKNLYIYILVNGYGAYKNVDKVRLAQYIKPYNTMGRIKWCNVNCDYIPFLKGQQGHYLQLNEEQYKEALRILQ